MSPKDALLEHLLKTHWQTTPFNKGWQLNRKNDNAVYLSFTPHWTCLQQPLTGVASTIKGESWAERVLLYRYLLRQNERLFMVRFALNADNKPVLMAEVPAKAAYRPLFDKAIFSIIHYGPKCQEEINNFFQQPSLANAIKVSKTSEAFVDIISSHTKRHQTVTPGIPKKTIATYLKTIKEKGWGAQKEPVEQTWYLGYKGHVRFFDVYLTTTPNWVYFQIPLLVEDSASVLRADEREQALFMDYLLCLNDLLFMVKLGLNHDGQVLMLLEIPTETLDFALFRLATDALATALDRYAQEIFMMAALEHDSVLATQLTELVTAVPTLDS